MPFWPSKSFSRFSVTPWKFAAATRCQRIAYSNAIASFFTLLYAGVVFSRKMGMKPSDWKSDHDYAWMTDWWNVGKFSDSFVRNLFYMIVRMMNVVQEQGTYWVANGFIWAWLLLTSLPTGRSDEAGHLLRITCGCSSS